MVFLEEILPLPLLLINPCSKGYRVQTYLVIIVMIVIVGFFFFLICILTKCYQSQLGLDLSC